MCFPDVCAFTPECAFFLAMGGEGGGVCRYQLMSRHIYHIWNEDVLFCGFREIVLII